METQKDKILNLFYIEHLKVKEIAEKTKVTSAYITKVIKTDSRYMEEKNFRKEKSKEKRIQDNYEFVQSQHIQASMELSKSKKLTDENYRKWNTSAYKYNPSKHRYEFDESLGRAADVPKYIKER